MKLKSFEEFRSSVRQLPAFQAIHHRDQSRFLINAYRLAKERYQKEQWMETAGEVAKSSRASTTGKLLDVTKHLKNALADIERARGALPASWSKLMLHLQVEEASDLLRGAYDDLGFLIAMDISGTHPHHRTDFEKQYRAIYQNQFLDLAEERFSHVPARQARIDYLFVRALNSLLDKCKTRTGRPMRPTERHKIITRVFLAALEETYPEGRVKTALFRTSGQQSV